MSYTHAVGCVRPWPLYAAARALEWAAARVLEWAARHERGRAGVEGLAASGLWPLDMAVVAMLSRTRGVTPAPIPIPKQKQTNKSNNKTTTKRGGGGGGQSKAKHGLLALLAPRLQLPPRPSLALAL
jgi:hypothetical protein